VLELRGIRPSSVWPAAAQSHVSLAMRVVPEVSEGRQGLDHRRSPGRDQRRPPGRGYDSPTKEEPVRLVRRGMRRTLGTAQRQVRPVTVHDLRAMLEGLGIDPAGCRDRALLLLGFAGALRRSELVGLDVADITEGVDGLTVHLRRSKTDQEGAGRTVGIPFGSNPVTCPARAWRAWLEVSGITEGHAFCPVDRHGHMGTTRLSGNAVALVLKRHAARVGLDPSEVAGHSLRACLATSAAAAGVPERVIAQQTGHRGTAMLRRYIPRGLPVS
jgi:integrase